MYGAYAQEISWVYALFCVYGVNMPKPRTGESQRDFVSRCIPIVTDDGTAESNDQAVAICYQMFKDHNEQSGNSMKMETLSELTEAFKVDKTEADGMHPSRHYLVVEDAGKPSTWHLRVKGTDGKPDHRLMGAAWAALHGGYRGNVYSGPNKEQAISKLTALYKREGLPTPGSVAAKFSVKVAGNWELDVLGNPYGPDSDGQWFDENSQIVSGSEIPVVYYHSLDDGGNGFASVPVVIGKAINPTKKSDGTWWHVILDKAKEKAAKVWQAAQQGAAVASSGAIEYLSRLEIGGKMRPYDKRVPGRIAVWHMGELSLWENNTGKRRQAHPYAVAVPALKATYEQAGLTFPDDVDEPENDEPKADEKAAKIAKKNLQKRARYLMSTFDE